MTIFRFLAWGLLLAIAIVTIGPIGFRPETGAPVQFERALAFAAMGLAFVLAYPRHAWWIVAVLVVSAFGLEIMQMLTPGRHGRIIDALAKLAGGGIGMASGYALIWLRQRVGRAAN